MNFIRTTHRLSSNLPSVTSGFIHIGFVGEVQLISHKSGQSTDHDKKKSICCETER